MTDRSRPEREFHVEHLPAETISSLEDLWSLNLDGGQVARLERFAEWLVGEGLREGGVGPAESERVWDRHVLDSLSFGSAMASAGAVPATVLDLGSGVGLPGIPLAIALPATQVALLDRSARRCRLLRRVVRLLGLDNVEVIESNAERLGSRYEGVVMRAALPPGRLAEVVGRMESGGRAAVGWARGRPRSVPPLSLPDRATATLHQVTPGILETAAWILMIARP